ncbi:MAG TPA: hypothetical protein VNF68_13805 [Candidatus Baltobacteraceae bacterium]|nr:hypothetical protein [Candidatus Baltobacteraceae bacterium]
MSARIEIAIAAFFLAVGVAGPPLEPVRILVALLVCAAGAYNARFMAATSFLAVILAGWLQHGQLRLALLACAALLGIAVRLWGTMPRAVSIIAAASALLGMAWLFLG